MPGATTKYGIAKPLGTDPVADADETLRAALDRVDLLLGENGTANITPSAADTQTSVRVNYARSYAALAPLVPTPFATINEGPATAQEVNVWTSAPDATGFTLNIRASNVTTRAVRWFVRA